MKPYFAVEHNQKSSSRPPRQRASALLWFSRATFVWMSASTTRAGDLIACCCCWRRCTLADDSVAEQVRSQPIDTNRSEIIRSAGNCVETLTLLFTKLAPRTSSGSNGALPSARERLSGDYHSQNRKKREGGKQAIL